MANKRHHSGRHHELGNPAVHRAQLDPGYRCPRCGLTYDEMLARHGARAAKWIRGHKQPGVVATHPDQYQAEHARCSAQEGAATRNQRSASGYDWP